MAGKGLPNGNTFMQQAGLGNMARLEQVGSTNLPLSVGGTPSGNARAGAAANLRNTIDKLLGGNIQLNETRAVDLDATYQSAPHAAMGLTVGVSGRATIVNADVASHLAEFQWVPSI
jgi:predicted RNA-binding Zn ribbon-like protein